MLANLGFSLLLLCLVCTSYSFLSATGAAILRHRRLYLSSKVSLSWSAVMCLVAAIILWYSYYQRDYSILYIAKTSSNDLPSIYTFTAFWSSLEGSHFLWTLTLSIIAVIVMWTHSRENEHIMPYVVASLAIVLAWMFYLLTSYSDPFVRQLPTPPNGNGMNELLQNPYMTIHPPLLFLGYTGLAVPFGYAIAALCYGDITEGWLKTVRRWTLFAWVVLTAAISLGGRWAYVELGWAGYWAWDPVENSSLMPWIVATALLHSLLIQEKLGHLKRLSLILCFFGFFMSYFGTFITRSGVVSSVHAFAESPIGPNYLSFLGFLAFVSCIIYAFRAPSVLPSESDKVWGVSKESALVVTLFLLLSLFAIVFIGTIFPIITEWAKGQRISIQAPYFNKFAPWIGLGLIMSVAIGNLMRYQSNKIPGLKSAMIWATGLAIPLSALLIFQGEVLETAGGFQLGAQVVGMYLAAWSFVCLCFDLKSKLQDLKYNYGLFFSRNLGYFGSWVAHIGFLVSILGFLGNYRGIEKQVQINAGGVAELNGYFFLFDQQGIDVTKELNYTLFAAPLTVSKEGEILDVVRPAHSVYPTKKGQTFHEIGVIGSLWNDVYVVLTDFDRKAGKSANFNLHINPTVRFVWISIFIMCIGGLIAIFDKYRGNRSRDVVAAQWEGN